MTPAGKTEVRERIIEEAVRVMAPHIGGWIETLGRLGGPPGEGDEVYGEVSAATRVSAAKAGMAFVSQYLKEMDNAAQGQTLMAELARIGAFVLKAEVEVEDGERIEGTGAHRALDAGHPGEAADLVES